MNRRILKNYTRSGIKNIFRGREVWFGPKEGKSFDLDDEEDRALYYFWKGTYEFLDDITSKVGENK